MTIPLSILDLAPISAGSDAATALRNTVDLAQHADRWGFKRYWVAEHHFVAVASSSPAVLVGQIAAATSAYVWAPRPCSWATRPRSPSSSFGSLAAFHPDRIDLGSGARGRSAPRRSRRRPTSPAHRASGTRSTVW